jgi:hypothetical protein
MIADTDIWRAALAMVKRYGDDAMLEASERADQLLDDMAGAETWHRIILNAIERLQAKARRGRRCIDAETGAGAASAGRARLSRGGTQDR